MTDIHTHVLPKIDDGAPDRETAARMLEELRSQGVTTAVLTPHYYGRFHSPRAFLNKRKEAFDKIRDVIPQGMNVRLGAEVHFSDAFAGNEQSAHLAIEGTRYVLTELPFPSEWNNQMFRKIRYFMDETDCVPIIAHFCRYLQVRKNPALLSELAAMGCLLQVNASAFLDPKDRRLIFAAMKHNLVHYIGSDCHNLADRAPDYKAAIDAAKKAGYADKIEEIQQTMKDILADREIVRKPFRPVKKILTFYV